MREEQTILIKWALKSSGYSTNVKNLAKKQINIGDNGEAPILLGNLNSIYWRPSKMYLKKSELGILT